MREWLAVPSALELLGREWPPKLIDDLGRVAVELGHGMFEMFAPEAEASRLREGSVAADDVHLGVVEERVLVQVGRADGEPVVVDDTDLGVHVDGTAAGAGLGQRASEEA